MMGVNKDNLKNGAVLLASGLTVLFLFAACSKSDDFAGISTVETENALVIQVVDAKSEPVAGAIARVRSASYLKTLAKEDNVSGVIAEWTSDSLGLIRLDSLPVDSATIEILNHGEGVFTTLLSREVISANTVDTMQLAMQKLGSVSGLVNLPTDVTFANVQVYGTDRVVQTDFLGVFEIDSLSPAEYRLRITVEDSVYEETFHVASEKTTRIAVGDTLQNSTEILVIDFESGLKSNFKSPALEGSAYIAMTDTNVVMNPAEDSVEQGLVKAGAGREGTAFHWTTSAPNGRWSFFGMWICSADNPCNLNSLDSVEFYIRGIGNYSFNIESLGDLNYNGKAIYKDTIPSLEEWTRVVVTPAKFLEGDSSWGNLGWKMIYDKVTNISVAAYGDAEVWLDDIRLYGVRREDLVK